MSGTGITPPSDPSSQERSRSSQETRALVAQLGPNRVPAMSTHIERVGQANRGSPAAASSDTSSVERGPHNRGFRNRNPYPGRPQPSSSSTVPPVDLNATQATFLAGAAVHQAHQASMVAEHASNAALHFQQQAQVTQQNAVRQQAQFHQAATAIQSRAEAYVRQAQEEARSAGVERDEVARQASQTVEGFRREAVAEVQATQSQLEARANQWLNENMSQIMDQMESRDARLRSQEDALRGRDEEILDFSVNWNLFVGKLWIEISFMLGNERILTGFIKNISNKLHLDIMKGCRVLLMFHSP